MTTPQFVPFHTRIRSSRRALIGYLKNNDLSKFGYVHISGHGSIEKCMFHTPKGSLIPEQFPVNCFANKLVTLSACSLGDEDFAERFMDRTSANYVIAPLDDVVFADSALWYITFYYHIMHKRESPDRAYELTKKTLKNVVEGGFNFWHW